MSPDVAKDVARRARPSRIAKEQMAISSEPLAASRFGTSVLLAIATAILLWASYFPADLGFLGWVALVPMLFLLQPQRPLSHALAAAWIGGWLFCLASYQWIRIASLPMYPVWIGLATMMSLQFPLFIWIVRRLVTFGRWPLVVAAPITWVALEFLRAIIGIGFPWYFMAHTQHAALPIIQIADLGGVYLVSLLVVTVNVAVYHLVSRQWLALRWSLPTALMGLLATLGYGWYRLNEVDAFPAGPKVALIQGNLAQDIRNDPNQGESTNDHYLRLAYEAAALRPDLIVCPETALEFWYDRIEPEVGAAIINDEWRQGAATAVEFRKKFAQDFGTDFLFGLVMRWLTVDGKRKYNAAVHVGADGEEKGWYAKMYLLPFGEYIPFRNTLPFMQWLSPYDFEYSTDCGDRFTRFLVRNIPFSVLICYEDTVPHLARRFMVAAEPAFFINISNDGWFKGWEEHEQHAVTAKFRCVECRRAMARSVNMGVTCVIDSNGRIVALPGGAKKLQEAKAFSAVLLATIPLDARSSFYVRYGDWLATMCWLLVIFGMATALVRMRREEVREVTTAANSA